MKELWFWWPYTWLRQLWCWVRGHQLAGRWNDTPTDYWYEDYCPRCGKVWR